MFSFQLGLYPKSGLHLIDDTSNLAKQAVQDLVGSIPRDGEGEGCPEGSITDFRYQVRIAMGKHFAKFCFFLLPFYVGLKVWWFFVSVLIGYVFGYTYLYVVYKSRKRFRKHRGKVALLASAYMSIVSALMLMEGMVSVNLNPNHVVWSCPQYRPRHFLSNFRASQTNRGIFTLLEEKTD
eukprot:CCRYP_013714-RE/>CCRYP_013714-RE protein AED:0.38 eAED:0.38 QI:506/1/1/1/1/1/2/22/179